MYDDPPPPSSGNTAVKIVLIVGGVFVCLAVVCGGLTYLIVTSITKVGVQISKDMGKVGEQLSKDLGEAAKELGEVVSSQMTAQVFLEDLRNERFDDAYRNATTEFQKAMKQAELKALITKYPFTSGTDQAPAPQPVLVHKGNAEHRFEVPLNPVAKKQVKLTLILRRGGEEWKVDRLVFPDDGQKQNKPE